MKKTPFETSLFVPFHCADPAGVVFFASELTLFHSAFERFVMEHLHVLWENWFQNKQWCVPIRHIDAHYLHPLFAGQPCHITIETLSLSTSSFTLSSTIRQNEAVCCTIKSVHVFCDKETGKKIAVPEEIVIISRSS